jgi:protein disulfide-isomerase A1
MYQSNADFAKKVTIAKVDATANDVPEEIGGFPTIKLYPAGGKGSPIDYSGDRSIASLADFIRDNGKYKIDANAAANDSGAKGDDTVSEAAEAVKSAVKDTDDEEAHDEL